MLEESMIAQVYSLGRMWMLYGEDFLVSKMLTNFADGVTTKYTKAELVQMHPRLYDAALVIAKEGRAFPTSQVVDKLKRLYCPLNIEDHFGDMIGIYDVMSVTCRGEMVSFEGFCYIYSDSLANLKNADLLSEKAVTATTFCTRRDWLQQAYPEWEKKYQLACELGIEPLAAFMGAVNNEVLTNSLPPPTDLVPDSRSS